MDMYKTEEAQRAKNYAPEPLLSDRAGLPAVALQHIRGIRGVTDREAEFPRIGELRKGAAKQGNRPGLDLGPVFRFTSDSEATVARFVELFGHEPREIKAYIPFRTTEEAYMVCQEQWAAGGLLHRCDGQVMYLWRDKAGQMRTDEQPCPGGCKQVGRLKVLIPKLTRMGVVTVLSTSFYDVLRVTQELRAFEGLRGDLRGIPFVLSRRKQMVSMPLLDKNGAPIVGENGIPKRVRREKWLISIEPSHDWAGDMMEAMRVAALPRAEYPAVPAPVTGEIAAQLDEPVPDFDDDDNGNGHDDRQVDEDTGEIVDANPQPEPVKQERTERGKKLAARLQQIVADLAAIGQEANLDPAWLQGATEAEMVEEGQRLKLRLDVARKQQPPLEPDMESEAGK